MYQALYRRWRPKTFDDVVGQPHITTTLKNALAAGKPSHAYIFVGSRGTGKTTSAKIIAKAVNCLHPQNGNPCCECDICRGIDSGSMVDVVEIDAASNNGVDNIRDLREEANFTPNLAKYRVYIIDEVHMLSVGAFNALLKIMEEPPSHVIFILATTEVHKVPATILSRCQRFDFRRIDSDVIAARLTFVADSDNIVLDEDAAMLIARLADGGMRDALSLLDLCSSYAAHITAETVSEAAGLVGQDYLFEICAAVAARDSGTALTLIGQLGAGSAGCDRLCEQLIAHFRNLMVVKSVAQPAELIVCLPAVLERYKEQAATMKLSAIIYAMTVLQQTLSVIYRAVSQRTELEMAILKLCDPTMDMSVTALTARIEELEKKLNLVAAGGHMDISPAPASATTSTTPSPAPSVAASKGASAKETTKPTAEATVPVSAQPEAASAPQGEHFARWTEVLSRLAGKNPMLHAMIKDAGAKVSGDTMIVETDNEAGRKMLADNDFTRQSLSDAIAEVTGTRYRIVPAEATNMEAAPEDENPLDLLIEQAREKGIEITIQED